MNSPTCARPVPLASCTARRPRAARRILDLLGNVDGGRLAVLLPDGDSVLCGSGEPRHELVVRHWDAFGAALARGDIGFGEAYLRGEWDSPDLAGLLAFLSRNREALARAIYGRPLSLLTERLLHRMRANSRAGSRRNIAAHYDLGNDFYATWLDETMTYSSALWEGEAGRDLAAAQRAKYRRILSRLNPAPGDGILEIGCGWGGFAEEAVREAGARVVGVTLSQEQLAWARRRAVAGGYAERAEFALSDYRDLAGRCSHIVAIEMFEAVGERYWPLFFDRLRSLLRPGGRAVVQTITVAEPLFARYRRGTDFIQRHVFPGGMLPSPTAFAAAAARQGLTIADDFAFGADYARTLATWQQRFAAAAPRLATLGLGARFERLWRFYLAYCEAGFATGDLDVHQFELHRTGT